GLIEPHPLLELEYADRLEQSKRSERIGVGCVFRRLEADLHVALCGQIVDFRRLGFLDKPNQIRRIGHVAVVKKKFRVTDVWIDVEVIDARGVERRRAPLDAMDNVTLLQQKLRQEGTILTRCPGDQRAFFVHSRCPFTAGGNSSTVREIPYGPPSCRVFLPQGEKFSPVQQILGTEAGQGNFYDKFCALGEYRLRGARALSGPPSFPPERP